MPETQKHRSPEDTPFYDQYEVLVPDARAKKFAGLDPASEETKVAVLEDYLSQFDKMISVIQGRDVDAPPYDTVIFLDKSARPLSWMLSELWDDFAEPIETSEGDRIIPKKPDQKYLNIDRLLWRKDQEVENEFHDISPDDIHALRSIFQFKQGNVLDGQRRILVVDEISESGDTQRIASKLIEAAFPDATVRSFAYMTPEIRLTKAGPSYEYPSFPAWYPPKDSRGHHAEDGRGVLDPLVWDADSSIDTPRRTNKFLSSPPSHRLSDEEIRDATTPLMQELEELADEPESEENQERKASIQQRLGKLSTGLVVRDPKAEMLRRDVRRLGRDFRAGRLLPIFTAVRDRIGDRDADDYYSARRDRMTVKKPLYRQKK